jgi:hypothetical protein
MAVYFRPWDSPGRLEEDYSSLGKDLCESENQEKMILSLRRHNIILNRKRKFINHNWIRLVPRPEKSVGHEHFLVDV